jgi:hypothetical protein
MENGGESSRELRRLAWSGGADEVLTAAYLRTTICAPAADEVDATGVLNVAVLASRFELPPPWLLAVLGESDPADSTALRFPIAGAFVDPDRRALVSFALSRRLEGALEARCLEADFPVALGSSLRSDPLSGSGAVEGEAFTITTPGLKGEAAKYFDQDWASATARRLCGQGRLPGSVRSGGAMSVSTR